MVTEITPENFEKEVVNSNIPVIADFWAPWCGPCQMMSPIFEELSEDYQGQIKFVKINVDENQSIASENGVQGIPALIIFIRGAEVQRIVGFQPKEALREKLDEVL